MENQIINIMINIFNGKSRLGWYNKVSFKEEIGKKLLNLKILKLSKKKNFFQEHYTIIY